MDFFNSKFIEDLKQGKLPAVTIDNITIAKLGAMLVVAMTIVVLIYQITKRVKPQ